ncbi:hypothetical protein ACOMHN_047533 [Nucella lapillus]
MGSVSVRSIPEDLPSKQALWPRKQREYRQVTRDCSSYRKTFGFRDMTYVSPHELSFPLAFSILVYKDAEQVERLLRAIYRPHNVYCIHVDAKAGDSFRKKVALFSRCLTNVFLSSVSVSVRWGTFSTLEAEVQCVRQLWTRPPLWRYYINLTGQEFPLKTNRELVQILTAFQGANDITGDSTRDTHRWQHLPPPPHHLLVYKGSVHVAATRAFVDYALHSNVSRQLLAWLKRGVVVPDEVFYNTLNFNTHLGVPGSVTDPQSYRHQPDSFMRYKIWQKASPTSSTSSSSSSSSSASSSSSSPCSGRFVRFICHFGVGDLSRLVGSSKMFANKFTYNFQPLAYDCLDLWLIRKMQEEEEEEEEVKEKEEEMNEEEKEEDKKEMGKNEEEEDTEKEEKKEEEKEEKNKEEKREASRSSSSVATTQQSKTGKAIGRRGGWKRKVAKKLDLRVYQRAPFVRNRYTGPVKVW